MHHGYKMKIVILGGSGYLASCLCFYLKKKNKIILGTRNIKKINYKFKNVEIKKVNYLSYKSIEKILKKTDYIFHLVGANSEFSEKNKKKSLILKKKTTKIILNAAFKTNSKIIYFSTSKVYKNFNKLSINEDSKVLGTNQYTNNHIMAENLILEDIKKNKTQHKIIRLSSVFGLPFYYKSKEAFNLIINSMCLEAVKKRKISIKDSSTIRDFFPSSMFETMLKHLFSNKKNNILNLGYQTCSLFYIAQIIQKSCIKNFSFRPKIVTTPYIEKKNFPLFKSKYLKKKKIDNKIKNEISKLLKVIVQNV